MVASGIQPRRRDHRHRWHRRHRTAMRHRFCGIAHTLTEHAGSVTAAGFGPDGNTLAATSYDKTSHDSGTWPPVGPYMRSPDTSTRFGQGHSVLTATSSPPPATRRPHGSGTWPQARPYALLPGAIQPNGLKTADRPNCQPSTTARGMSSSMDPRRGRDDGRRLQPRLGNPRESSPGRYRSTSAPDGSTERSL